MFNTINAQPCYNHRYRQSNQIDFQNINFKNDRKLFYVISSYRVYILFYTFLTWFLYRGSSWICVRGVFYFFFFYHWFKYYYYHYGLCNTIKNIEIILYSQSYRYAVVFEIYPKSIETYTVNWLLELLTYNRPDFTRTYIMLL